MAISDGHGLPLAVHVASASPHETKLVVPTIERRFLAETPQRLIGDRAYDSDPLDTQICERFGVQLIAPHTSMRSRKAKDVISVDNGAKRSHHSHGCTSLESRDCPAAGCCVHSFWDPAAEAKKVCRRPLGERLGH